MNKRQRKKVFTKLLEKWPYYRCIGVQHPPIPEAILTMRFEKVTPLLECPKGVVSNV